MTLFLLLVQMIKVLSKRTPIPAKSNLLGLRADVFKNQLFIFSNLILQKNWKISLLVYSLSFLPLKWQTTG